MRNPIKIDEFGEFSDKLASALATYTITSSEEAASIRGLNHCRAQVSFSLSRIFDWLSRELFHHMLWQQNKDKHRGTSSKTSHVQKLRHGQTGQVVC